MLHPFPSHVMNTGSERSPDRPLQPRKYPPPITVKPGDVAGAGFGLRSALRSETRVNRLASVNPHG